MNFSSTAPALIVAAGISLTAMGAASPEGVISESKVAQIRHSLASAKLVEAPYRAAHLVAAASKSERSAVARTAVGEVLSAHPTAVSATVRAVLTVAPDEVSSVMEAVMEKAPVSYKIALAAVNDMNPASIPSAIAVVSVRAPGEAQSLAAFGAEASSVSGTAPEYAAVSKRPSAPKITVPVKSVTVQTTQVKAVLPPVANVCLLAR